MPVAASYAIAAYHRAGGWVAGACLVQSGAEEEPASATDGHAAATPQAASAAATTATQRRPPGQHIRFILFTLIIACPFAIE